jgi:hypothetical protein
MFLKDHNSRSVSGREYANRPGGTKAVYAGLGQSESPAAWPGQR